MKITKSKDVTVLYRVDELYGWRNSREYLPKNAEVVSVIAVVNGETTAVSYCDPTWQATMTAELDELATRSLAERLESGKPLSANQKSTYIKRDTAVHVTSFLRTMNDLPVVPLPELVNEIDDYERRLLADSGLDSNTQIIVCGTLYNAELLDLECCKSACVRLVAALAVGWRYELLKNPSRWEFWHNVLVEAFPSELEKSSNA